jgi:hypothetical protein
VADTEHRDDRLAELAALAAAATPTIEGDWWDALTIEQALDSSAAEAAFVAAADPTTIAALIAEVRRLRDVKHRVNQRDKKFRRLTDKIDDTGVRMARLVSRMADFRGLVVELERLRNLVESYEPVVDAARVLAKHWRDQDGANASVIDELVRQVDVLDREAPEDAELQWQAWAAEGSREEAVEPPGGEG